MLVEEKEVVLAHEPDAAWIMALYRAIHGGDPPPETVAASIIGTMAPYLKGFGQAFTTQQMEAGFGTLGVKVTQPPVEAHEANAQVRPPRQYCFKFQGKTICIILPTVKVPPPL
jgi:hypothetical protein